MMAVAFHALNPQRGTHGKILQERHGADIAQVLAAHNGCFAFALALLDEAAVGEPFENAFAILVTGAGVAEAQGGVEAIEGGVRFIYDNWWSIRPSLKLIVQRIRQRHIAVKRLLDEQQSFKEWPKCIVILNGGPEGLKIGDALKLLVAIQRKGEIRRGISGDYLGKYFQAAQISVGLAVDFDFEMAKPVGGDAVGKCLG